MPSKPEQIDELLNKIEPRFQRAFKLGLESIRDTINISEIERAIDAGDLNRAAALINELIVASSFIAFNREIQNAVQAGGDIAARWARADKIIFDLNVTESNTARFINQYQAQKVREIGSEIQRNIGEIIRNGVNSGDNPRQVARRVRESIGLTQRQQQAVENFERLLREGKSDALNRALRDKRFDRSIIAAIEGRRDLSESQIQKMVSRYRQRYINYRATTIARTEAIRLVSLGQDQFWQQAANEGLVQPQQLRRKWIPTLDGKTREAHAAIPRMNPDGVGMNEPFKSPLGPIRFPGDPSAPAANVINCFLPDNLIFNRGVKAVICRRYTGDVVKINLSNGINLTVTPNHPIFTKRGWVSAGEIVETDQLINCDICDISNGPNPHVANMYTSAESLYRFFKISGGVDRSGISAVDLHGEVIPNEDVEVISAPSFLMDAFESTGFDGLDKIKLKHTDMAFGSLLAKRMGVRLSSRNRFVSSFFVRLFGKRFSFGFSHFRKANFVRFRGASLGDSKIIKAFINKTSIATNFFRNFIDSTRGVIQSFYFLIVGLSFPSVRLSNGFISYGDRFFVSKGLEPQINNAIFGHFFTNPKLFRNARSRLPSFIKLFNFRQKRLSFFQPVSVSSISRFHYNGPVYNFETNNGLIIANNIVTHNCRCATFVRVEAV